MAKCYSLYSPITMEDMNFPPILNIYHVWTKAVAIILIAGESPLKRNLNLGTHRMQH